MDELKRAREALDDALYGKDEKADKAIYPRLRSLERDRNLMRLILAILGGIAWPAIAKYVPWLSKDGK